MNKQYENPTIEVVEFNAEEILTASGTFGGSKTGDKELDFWE